MSPLARRCGRPERVLKDRMPGKHFLRGRWRKAAGEEGGSRPVRDALELRAVLLGAARWATRRESGEAKA